MTRRAALSQSVVVNRLIEIARCSTGELARGLAALLVGIKGQRHNECRFAGTWCEFPLLNRL
jgi:hypothetical protein